MNRRRTLYALAVLGVFALGACGRPRRDSADDDEFGRRKGPPPEREPRVDLKARFDNDFKKADVNGDGVLTRDELATWLPSAARDFREIDTDGDGKVTREELQRYLQGKPQ